MPDLELATDLADIQADIIGDLTETVKTQDQTIAKLCAWLKQSLGNVGCPSCRCIGTHADGCELDQLLQED